MTNKSGERYNYDSMGTVAFYRHLIPYEYVKDKLVPGTYILDYGCGSGGGTNLLNTSPVVVVGYDSDENIIRENKKKYGYSKFISSGYYKENAYDYIICFHVVEHVGNDVGLIRELYDMLKPGGALFISTPNRNIRLKGGQRPFNRYHIREYDSYQFKKLCSRYFNDVCSGGLYANDDVIKIEKKRCRGLLAGFLATFGFRELLPEWLDNKLVTIRNKKYGFNPKVEEDSFHISFQNNNMDNCLDLINICKK